MISTVDPGKLYYHLAFAARFAYGRTVTPEDGAESPPSDDLEDWHAVISWVLGELCTFTEEQMQAIGLPIAWVDEPTHKTDGGFEISNTVLTRMQHDFGQDENPTAQRDEL